MQRSVFSAGAIAAAALGGATAQPVEDAGLYGRIGGGAIFPETVDQSSDYGDAVFTSPPPDRRRIETDNGFTLGAALGFRYRSGFRTEFEYRFASANIDFVEISGGFDETVGGPPPPVRTEPDADASVHYLMSNVIYDFRNASRFTPFVGVGLGGAHVSLLDGESDWGFAYQGRAGLALEMGPSTRLGVEYVHTRARNLEFETDVLATPASVGGDPLAASNVMVFLQKNF